MDDRDRRILDFEQRWWRYAGNKEAAIRTEFNISPIRYTQLLNKVLDDPDSQIHNPLLVNRLRRIRDRRAHARDARKNIT